MIVVLSFVDGDLLGAAEILEFDVLELDAEVFVMACAGQGGDVFEHGLAAVAKARALTAAHCKVPRSLFHHESARAFAFNILSDDQEGLAHLGGLREQREQVLHRC